MNDVVNKLVAARIREETHPEYAETLPWTLVAVRSAMEKDGHIFHRETTIRRILGAICEGDETLPELEWAGLLASGYVVDVTPLVPETHGVGKWYAFRQYIEGEIGFAKAAVEHAANGGKATIYSGEPGTGKTHSVAVEAVKAARDGKIQAIGSALGHSAENLNAEIAKVATEMKLAPAPKIRAQTIHKSHDAKVNPEQYAPGKFTDVDQFIMDEMGQLGADTAGMAARRWHSDARVILSIGPGQLLPIGPGQIGEDLLACLGETGGTMQGWELCTLLENYRVKQTLNGDKPSTGIVYFFRAIAGETVGHYEARVAKNRKMRRGLVLLPVEASEGKSGFATSLDFAPGGGVLVECQSFENTPSGAKVRFFCPLDRAGCEVVAAAYLQFKAEVQRRHIDIGIDRFETGEEVALTEESKATRAAGWRKGMTGIVKKTASDGNLWIKPKTDDSQAPQDAGNRTCRAREVCVARNQIRRFCALTGHRAQGLETDVGVVVALSSRITNKRWLYTAISRCKKMCVLIYEEGTLKNFVTDPIKNAPRRTLFPLFFRMFRKERGV